MCCSSGGCATSEGRTADKRGIVSNTLVRRVVGDVRRREAETAGGRMVAVGEHAAVGGIVVGRGQARRGAGCR